MKYKSIKWVLKIFFINLILFPSAYAEFNSIDIYSCFYLPSLPVSALSFYKETLIPGQDPLTTSLTVNYAGITCGYDRYSYDADAEVDQNTTLTLSYCVPGQDYEDSAQVTVAFSNNNTSALVSLSQSDNAVLCPGEALCECSMGSTMACSSGLQEIALNSINGSAQAVYVIFNPLQSSTSVRLPLKTNVNNTCSLNQKKHSVTGK